jgi:multimeric flavodoxin WrbA
MGHQLVTGGSYEIISIQWESKEKMEHSNTTAKALEGAASQGANTELIHLYDLNYKGCISCFACKTLGGKSYGKCAVQDDLAPIFSRIEQTDAILMGSPIYWGDISGEMKSFLERLMFQYTTYTNPPGSLSTNTIKAGFIYTMNVTEEIMKDWGYALNFSRYDAALRRIFGESEYMCCFDTYQFDDYSKVLATRFDPVKKKQRHEEVFPLDCQKAFDMGARLVAGK